MFKKPAEREIYKYWNGTKDVAGDPLGIMTRLMSYPDFDLELDCKLLMASKVSSPSGLKRETALSLRRTMKATRYAFRVKRYQLGEDGVEAGLQDEEIIGLALDFFTYMNDVKKNTLLFPTQQSSTELASSSGAVQNQPMKPSLA